LRVQVHDGANNARTFDFISYFALMFSIYQKQYINVNTIDFGNQLIDTMTEFIQGPCKENQQIISGKVIDTCRDLIQSFQEGSEELLY
jgi:hypothetical protein